MRRLRAVAIALALAAAIAMPLVALVDGAPRALYGSDTRASGLLLGATVALALPPSAWHHRATGARGRRLRLLGLIVLALLLTGLVAMAPQPRWLTQGGPLLIAMLTAVLIAAVVRSAELDRLLGVAPLRWMGRRSYALYLWHWPVVTVIGGPAALTDARAVALCLVASLTLAGATHRFIEAPLRGTQPGGGTSRPVRPGLAISATAVACGVATVAALLTAQGRQADPRSAISDILGGSSESTPSAGTPPGRR